MTFRLNTTKPVNSASMQAASSCINSNEWVSGVQKTNTTMQTGLAGFDTKRFRENPEASAVFTSDIMVKMQDRKMNFPVTKSLFSAFQTSKLSDANFSKLTSDQSASMPNISGIESMAGSSPIQLPKHAEVISEKIKLDITTKNTLHDNKKIFDRHKNEIKISHLGKEIAQGGRATVYEDKNNLLFVYKVLKQDSRSTAEDLKEEVINFTKYYGMDSAQFINDKCIRMLKLPGKTLRKIEREDNGIKRIRMHKDAFNEMIIKMHSLELIHGDFTMDNILLDEETGTFFPIDITNIRYSNEDFIDTDILLANAMIEYLTKGNDDKVIAFKRQRANPTFNVKMIYVDPDE